MTLEDSLIMIAALVPVVSIFIVIIAKRKLNKRCQEIEDSWKGNGG